jgi:hypothetical protein
LIPRPEIDRLLRERHGANSRAELRVPDDTGAFPPALLGRPRAVVADTTYLCQDVAYACRQDKRTALVTLANEGLLRIFCAEHVAAEVIEKGELRSANRAARVSRAEFIARWKAEYLPHIRIVPDDAIPDDWLAPAELARLDTLRQTGELDDPPSVKLALVTASPYISKDSRALAAVYGNTHTVDPAAWLDALHAAGDAAELERMLAGVLMLGVGAAMPLVYLARALRGLLGPLSVAPAAAAGAVAWQWLKDPGRAGLRAGAGDVVSGVLELALVEQLREARFESVRPAVPSVPELVATNPRAAVVGRAAAAALATDARGHLSAAELAVLLRSDIRVGEPTLRALMRGNRAFNEVYRGRWQLGAPP